MQINAHIEPAKDTEGRLSVSLEVTFRPHIQRSFSEPKFILSRDTQGPIPFTLYQHAENYITLATNRVLEFTGRAKQDIPVKPFRNRLAPVASYNKESRLLLFFPGRMQLGYINRNDAPKAKAWLETLVKNAEEDIPGVLEEHINGRKTAETARHTVIQKTTEVQGIESTKDSFARASVEI